MTMNPRAKEAVEIHKALAMLINRKLPAPLAITDAPEDLTTPLHQFTGVIRSPQIRRLMVFPAHTELQFGFAPAYGKVRRQKVLESKERLLNEVRTLSTISTEVNAIYIGNPDLHVLAGIIMFNITDVKFLGKPIGVQAITEPINISQNLKTGDVFVLGQSGTEPDIMLLQLFSAFIKSPEFSVDVYKYVPDSQDLPPGSMSAV